MLIMVLLAGCRSIDGHSMTVAASAGWQAADVQLEAGQRVSIVQTSGLWTSGEGLGPYNANGGRSHICRGSDCVEPVPGFRKGGLVARVGQDGVPFAVGERQRFMAERSGLLYLRMNDIDLSDNEGAITVEIRVQGRE